MREDTFAVFYNGNKIYVKTDIPLSVSLLGEMPCGGHGKCGKCKAKVTGSVTSLTESERSLLTEEEIQDGIRLLCQCYPTGDCTVLTEETKTLSILIEGSDNLSVSTPMFSHFGIAIDIGTTTLAGRLYSHTGDLLSSAGMQNPQTVYGADVISRIEYALKDKRALSASIRFGICTLVTILCEKSGIHPEEVDALVLCGNTTMLYLLTETDVEPLSRAPFTLTRAFGEWDFASTLSLNVLHAQTRVFLTPVISAFVGSDTVCAILGARFALSDEKTTLLVDVGTNGEIALSHRGTLRVCSTAAGPALEGVDISCGMRATDGAIDRVTLQEGTLLCHTIGESKPSGICGSGLIDAVACMLDAGLLDESGYLEEDMVLAEELTLTQRDIRQLQLAKSAISAGILTLLHEADTSPAEVERFILAGGLGTTLNPSCAARIGLFPKALTVRCEAVGNGALDGASLLLLNEPLLPLAKSISQSAITVDLSRHPVFSKHFTEGMLFEE